MSQFHKEIKEAFALIEAAHNRALRERSDIQKEFEAITTQIDSLFNKTDNFRSKLTKITLFAE